MAEEAVPVSTDGPVSGSIHHGRFSTAPASAPEPAAVAEEPSTPPTTTQARAWAAASRGYAATVVTGLVAAGTVALSVAQPWLTARATVEGLPVIRIDVGGAEIAPIAAAFGFVLLAAFGAVIATRGWVRRSLGLLVVVLAISTAISVVGAGDASATVEEGLAARGWSGGGYTASSTGWRWLAGIGALGCLVAGSLVAWLGGAWPAMGSQYDAQPDPAASPHAGRSPEQPIMTEADVWRAIDRGHDPTQTS